MNIGRIFVESHRNAWGLMLRRLPAVGVIAAGALATSLATRALHATISSDIASSLLNWLIEVACLWITAPAAVSIFCYLILGEITDPNPFRRSAATGTYFNGAAFISLLSLAPLLLDKVLHFGAAHGSAGIAPITGALVAIWIMLTRLTTYLPGLAVGRDSNSIGQAIKESQGRFFFIAGSYVVALAPIFVLGVGLGVAVQPAGLNTTFLVLTSTALILIGLSVSALLYEELRLESTEPAQAASGSTAPVSQGPRGTFGRLTYQPPMFTETSGGSASSPLSAGSIARRAYGDLANIVREMWPVLLILSALYFVCAMAWFIAPIFVSSWVGRMIVRMLIFIGIAWLAAPYYIALHRFVSTGEVQWIPPRESYGRASAVYFAWAGMNVALWFLPLILGNTIDAFLPPAGSLAALLAYGVVFFIFVRITTLLPAAALEPERASWTQAMDDSRGRFRLFWLSTTGAAFPAIIVLVIIGQAAGSQTISALPFFALAVPALLILQIIPLAAGTRLYEMLPKESPITRLRQVIRQR